MDSYVGLGGRDLIKDIEHFTLRIAQKTTMGHDKEEVNTKKNSLQRNTEVVMDMFSRILFAPWLVPTLGRKLSGIEKPINEAKSNINSIVTKMIDSRLQIKNISAQSQPDIFIDHALIHLKTGNLTYQDVMDESIGLVLAAFETTASSIFSTLLLLAMYPEYQEQLFEELQETYPHTGDFDLTYEDTEKSALLDRIFNESLRLIPPVPIVARQAVADMTLSNGVLIPKGTNFLINSFHMHLCEDIWGPEAKIFNPDNFLPVNIQAKHPYSFIPFSKGPRNCIGWRYALMSSKITLIKLLRNYKFSTTFRYEDLVLIDSVTMKFGENPLLSLEKRNK
ncbi:uncharacterized protein Dwil_GK11539 [Drosophila willistoni]|uniref:Uncharacterized protein n=2 Tax=Drosophila willistoni TaxID=7260 RepID=A0A0Q9X0A3_DROWI|nr:uncharacterized protein Dwil_GK11539 [Drosophila willistoni]